MEKHILKREAELIHEQIWKHIQEDANDYAQGWNTNIPITIDTDDYSYDLNVDLFLSFDHTWFSQDNHHEEYWDVNIDSCDFRIDYGTYMDNAGDTHIFTAKEIEMLNQNK